MRARRAQKHQLRRPGGLGKLCATGASGLSPGDDQLCTASHVSVKRDDLCSVAVTLMDGHEGATGGVELCFSTFTDL